MAKKRPFYKKFRKTLYETVSDSGNSVLRYRGHDDKEHYVASSEAPGGTPMPSGGGMTEVTWQELKNKRDNGELIPGSLYRITDYQCTTTQENTRSAGHQFDIVLLALSEDKLAEEGWAMMNESNIYDVTFADGVTKKCYIYEYTEGGYNVVEPDTLIGTSGEIGVEFVSIDDVNKVLICDPDYGPNSNGMENEGLTYNYFQNSNLSAWKVWYCLDNDRSRFAWADDSVDEDKPEGISFIFDGATFNCLRYNGDYESDLHPVAWQTEDEAIVFTDNVEVEIGDNIYDSGGSLAQVIATVSSRIPAHEGTGLPNGRGVIYRLIDEWNNDCPYDFKNVQYIRPMTYGEYDPDNGEPTWVYTFTDTEEGEITDATAKSVDLFTNSFIERYCWAHKLSNNVVLTMDNGSNWIHVEAESKNNTFYNDPANIRLIHSQNMEIDGENDTIYINNKKVLTEE